MSLGDSESIIWFIRGMAIVSTVRTWVSPRWNRPEPCAVGSAPVSAEIGRRSATPRPSMRTPSLTTRARISFLLSERTASLTMPFCPANSPGSSLVPHSSATISAVTASVASLRSDLLAIVMTGASLSLPAFSTAAKISGV